VILRSYGSVAPAGPAVGLLNRGRRLRQLAASTEFDGVSRRLIAQARACEQRAAECDCLTVEEHLSVCRVSA